MGGDRGPNGLWVEEDGERVGGKKKVGELSERPKDGGPSLSSFMSFI